MRCHSPDTRPTPYASCFKQQHFVLSSGHFALEPSTGLPAGKVLTRVGRSRYVWDEDFKEWAMPASLDEVAPHSRARAEPRDEGRLVGGPVHIHVGATPEPEPEVHAASRAGVAQHDEPEEPELSGLSPPPTPPTTWVGAATAGSADSRGAKSPIPLVYRMKRRFNAAAYPNGGWRDAEDLDLDVGDLVERTGPAPHGMDGWSHGVKIGGSDLPGVAKCFPSAEPFAEQLGGEEARAALSALLSPTAMHAPDGLSPLAAAARLEMQSSTHGLVDAPSVQQSVTGTRVASAQGRELLSPGGVLVAPPTPEQQVGGRRNRRISWRTEENGELKNEFRQIIGAPMRPPPPLAITIPCAQVAEDDDTKEQVTVYEVNVQGRRTEEEEPDQWWVLRRFSQFATLHAALMSAEHLDTRELPALPRRTISSASDRRVEARRMELERILRVAAGIESIVRDDTFRQFVGLQPLGANLDEDAASDLLLGSLRDSVRRLPVPVTKAGGAARLSTDVSSDIAAAVLRPLTAPVRSSTEAKIEDGMPTIRSTRREWLATAQRRVVMYEVCWTELPADVSRKGDTVAPATSHSVWRRYRDFEALAGDLAQV